MLMKHGTSKYPCPIQIAKSTCDNSYMLKLSKCASLIPNFYPVGLEYLSPSFSLEQNVCCCRYHLGPLLAADKSFAEKRSSLLQFDSTEFSTLLRKLGDKIWHLVESRMNSSMKRNRLIRIDVI